ncbi:hypothetical protein, partial [Kingella kingae]|uniref:hypothetical protein n=1 Tax=Kingella kingae TaxID=504 RepID=UPI0025524209
ETDNREVKHQKPGHAPIFPLAHLTAYSGDMLGYLSEPLFQTDLRTASDGTDAAGKSWDSSDFLIKISLPLLLA